MIEFGFPGWGVVDNSLLFIVGVVDEFIDLVVVGEQEGVPELSEFQDDLAEGGVVLLPQVETPFAITLLA